MRKDFCHDIGVAISPENLCTHTANTARDFFQQFSITVVAAQQLNHSCWNWLNKTLSEIWLIVAHFCINYSPESLNVFGENVFCGFQNDIVSKTGRYYAQIRTLINSKKAFCNALRLQQTFEPILLFLACEMIKQNILILQCSFNEYRFHFLNDICFGSICF